MKFFNNVNNLEELKKEYRTLSKKHHPDLGGCERTMKIINVEYEKMFDKLKDVKKESAATSEKSSDFVNIINELIKYQNIEIEIVGSWLWIEGETFGIKEELKALGFKWSKTRKKWYLGEVTSKKKRGTKVEFDTLRSVYGSEKVKGNTSKQYAIG